MRLRTLGLGVLLYLTSLWAHAQPWEFGKPVNVTSTQSKKIFHHLESSGRHNIAISAGTVAIAWEDDSDGTPRVYLAYKDGDKQAFSKKIKISGKGEAYEPSLVALKNKRFVLAWEEDSRIQMRVVTPNDLGTTIILSKAKAAQPSLTVIDQQLLLVYSQREGRYGHIQMQRIEIDEDKLHLKQECAVDTVPVKDDQLYPSVASAAGRVIVAWEDRRLGHTIIMAAQNHDQNSCSFDSAQRISEKLSGKRSAFGMGHGVSRVALTAYGFGKVLAVWADKRYYREGHDIYAAEYVSGKKQLFGPNTKVQDSFGGIAQQWHATVAGNSNGGLIVGWDDNRDGDANIMLSWPEGNGWSDDYAVPGADGTSEQNHPTIILDQEGNLHLAWIERATIGGSTQIYYLFGRLAK